VPGAVHGPRVDPYHADTDPETHSLERADALEDIVLREGPETVGAIILEPVQNAGGCLTPEPAYFARVREICDTHDLLFISDETICSWGRLGTWFGAQHFGYEPDIITTAKGLTSAYVPMGAVIASARVVEPFLEPDTMFTHGLTFGGHPAAAAAALANIAIIEEEGLCARAAAMGERLQETLESMRDIPLVGDVRGVGLFRAIELVADQETKAALPPDALKRMTERIPGRLLEEGLICRAMHRGAPLLQFAPPLVISDAELAELERALRVVLGELAEAVL
jgi:adenosylmethionine-8-amino-7-oxononanoate aminotransferase